MNINRHNYEEFFLLYVDNELQQSERSEVENFVKQNADLASELSMLQQAILGNEDFTFSKKDLLYKKENSITLSNYEEYFVLFVDNELTDIEAGEVEKFVLKHPELQDEFSLLKQTKLIPEVVEYTGKERLYKTAKEKPVVFLSLMKISVAAAVIGLIALTWIFNTNNEATQTEEIITASAQPAEKAIENTNAGASVTQQATDTSADKAGDKGQPVLSAVQAPSISQTVSINKKTRGNYPVSEKSNSSTVKETPNSVRNPNLALVNEEPHKVIEGLNDGDVAKKVIIDQPSDIVLANGKNTIEDTRFVATNAVYRELDTDEEDNTILIGGAEINKNKLKGLFKKATKLLGRKNSEKDEEKTVRIAGFEFKTR